MKAHRAIVETDEQGRLKDLPVLPPHATVEAIFLVLDDRAKAAMNRRPPAALAGIKINGDIVAPAIDEGDWSLSS